MYIGQLLEWPANEDLRSHRRLLLVLLDSAFVTIADPAFASVYRAKTALAL